MDQLCDANTRNKSAGGGGWRGISGVYHHYTNGAHPNEMNSKNPSPPPASRRRGQTPLKRPSRAGWGGGWARWMVHAAVRPPSGAHRLAPKTRGGRRGTSVWMPTVSAELLGSSENLDLQFRGNVKWRSNSRMNYASADFPT